MKSIRVFLNALVVLAVSFVLALLSYQALEGAALTDIISVAVLVMDALVLIATFVNLFAFKGNMSLFIPTYIPGIALALSIILAAKHYSIPSSAMLIYDFFILYWYGYLVIGKTE